MATAEQARFTYDATKEFYRGDLKSDNKEYRSRFELAAEIWWHKAMSRVDRRALRLPMADGLIGQDDFAGQTPLEAGAMLYGAMRGMRAGNCGQMACVAIYIANMKGVALNDMWLVTVFNQNTKKSGLGSGLGWGDSKKMTFGHSWAALGAPPHGFFVDPCADFWCPAPQYASNLRVTLDKWQRQGKRICVGWGEDPKDAEWTNANDGALLSLLDEGTRQISAIQSNRSIPASA
jgi:hypothetical protein